MKIIVALILLLASFNGYAAVCPNGVHKTDGTTNQCPGHRTGLGITSISQTGGQIIGVMDAQGAGSDLLWYASAAQYPPNCTSLNYTYADLTSANPVLKLAAETGRQKCMNWRAMSLGTSSIAFGSTAVPSAGAFSSTVTGLTAGTTSYIHHFNKGGVAGVGKISLMDTQVLTTNSSGGGGGETLVADGGAASRFIGPGGLDSNDGLTHATRWLNPSKVSCALPAGTNIAILNTSVFTATAGSKMTICHDSTSLDWGIVASYKLNGSGVPIWTVDGIRGASEIDQKAKWLGPITDGCIAARTCDYRISAIQAAGLSSQYDARVWINANYVVFRGFEFEKSITYDFIVAGSGNTFYGDTSLGSTHHVILESIDSYQAAGAANVFVDGVRSIVYRDSTVDTWGLCYQLRSLGNSPTLTDDVCPPVAVPSAGGLVRSYNAQSLVENNDFYRGWGEGGVDCGSSTSHIIYRGNRYGGSTSVSQYMDSCSDTVTENAIIVGSNDFGLVGAGNTGPGISGTLASGIGIGIEDWHGVTAHNANNNLVRNNLIVRPATCYPWGLGTTPDNAGKTMGVRLIGNTCIAANGPDMDLWFETTGADLQVLDIKSNLWWNETFNTYTINSTTANTHNHSFTARSSNGGSNASTGSPQLVTSYETWATYKGPLSWPTFALARPDVGSPLNNAGVQAEAVVLTWADFGFGATEMADFKSGAITAENWVKERFYCSGSLNEVCGATPPKGVSCAAAGC